MRCESCDRSVDMIWLWCPDCGGALHAESPVVDLRPVDPDAYPVDWGLDPALAEAASTTT